MFKKRLLAIVAIAFSSLSAQAGNLYLGPTLSIVDNTTTQSNYRGLEPKLSIGYYGWAEDMYVAAEAFVVPATATIADNYTSSLSQSVKTNTSWGASILPGVELIDCVVAYARAGIVYSKFPGPNSWRMGGQFGAGLQLEVSRYWDVRAEYIFTAFRSMGSIGTPKTDQAGIGFMYKVLS